MSFQASSTNPILLFLVLLTPIFLLFGYGFIRATHTLTASDEYCESLVWDDIHDSETLSDIKLLRQPFDKFEHGERCWDSAFSQIFIPFWKRSRRRAKSTRRPKELNSQYRYIRVDIIILQTLLLICTVDDPAKVSAALPESFRHDGVEVEDIRKLGEGSDDFEEDSNLVSAHIKAACPQRTLAKLEVERVLEGFPPWFYRDTFQVDIKGSRLALSTPIRQMADLGRGGWIMALGMTDDDPLPLYYDFPWEVYDRSYDAHNFRTRRGGYFWKAMFSLRDVIRDHFLPAFPDESVVSVTIKRIETILEAEDEGAVSDETKDDTSLPGLTREQCEFVIDVFNSPHPAPELKRFLGKSLVPLMAAATSGVEKALKYIKKPGRELNTLIPATLRDASTIFLRDCDIRESI